MTPILEEMRKLKEKYSKNPSDLVNKNDVVDDLEKLEVMLALQGEPIPGYDSMVKTTPCPACGGTSITCEPYFVRDMGIERFVCISCETCDLYKTVVPVTNGMGGREVIKHWNKRIMEVEEKICKS